MISMRRSRIALAVLAVLLLGAGTGQAQQIPSPYEYIERTQSLGGFVGYVRTSTSLEVTDSTDAEFGPRSAPLFGLRYGMRFSGPLSGEASLGFMPTDRKLYAGASATDSVDAVPVETGETTGAALLIGDANLRFHLTGPRTWRGLAPFVVGSGGIVVDVAGTGDAEKEIPETLRFDFGPTFAVGAGVGTDWFPSDRLSLRVELFDKLWNIDAPAGFRSRARSAWKHNLGATIGAALHF